LTYFFEQLINGICQGSIYALFAIGYTLIVGVVGLVSFTHGEVIMIGAFSAYYFATLVSTNIVLTVLASFAGAGLIGIAIHKICYERFFEAPKHISLICTIGMSMLIKNLVQIWGGSATKGMPSLLGNGFVRLGSQIRVNYVQIAVMIVVLVLCILLSLFLNRTKPGIMLRAISQDKKAAALMGIHVSRAAMLGNIVGCGFGGIGGMLYALYYGSLAPTMGGPASMKAVTSAVLAGMTDIPTSAIAALIIGILENFGIIIIQASMRDVIAFIFLILILLILPKGLKMKRRV
jgi:branched-chain amino acid transport system permease protein